MLLMHQQRQMSVTQTKTTVWLLQRLGFQINKQKSILEPTKTLENTGFEINTEQMKLFLPTEKVEKIREECRELQSMKLTSVRKLAKIIGKMTAAVKAILPAPLQYRHLQRLKSVGLQQNHQSYETVVTLNAECLEELKWWVDHIDVWNGKSCLKASPDLALEIQTDASKTGWGAHCEGIKTQGLWTPSEKTLQIIVLELKAVLFAVKAFHEKQIRLSHTCQGRQYNKSSLHQQHGGTKSPNLMAVTISGLTAYRK